MKTSHHINGFSLIETLVAISILLLVIVGPLTITTSASRSTSFGNEQITAYLLAQEGTELIQKARDDLQMQYFRGFNPDPWADFTRQIGSTAVFRHCYATPGCATYALRNSAGSLFTVPSGGTSLLRCTGTGENCLLYYDTANNVRSRFVHITGSPSSTQTATSFKRIIRMSLISPDEVRVVSTVTWRSGLTSAEQRVSVETALYNTYGLP